MAETGIRVTVNVPGLEKMRALFSGLPKYMAGKHMAAGLRRAAEDGGTLAALKANTPKGPTGNLRRSIAVKSKIYARQGVGVAIVGYKSGRKWKDPYDNTKLGYHQGLVEFGTKERFRKTKDGRLVSTGKMPVGGRFGRPPVRTSWEQTRGNVESKIVSEMEKAFNAAVRELASQTIKGGGNLL